MSDKDIKDNDALYCLSYLEKHDEAIRNLRDKTRDWGKEISLFIASEESQQPERMEKGLQKMLVTKTLATLKDTRSKFELIENYLNTCLLESASTRNLASWVEDAEKSKKG